MSAVIVEFPMRDKAAVKTVREADHGPAQVIIFTGVRHERLEEISLGDETDTPRSPRHKKTS
jgi:hypothetical protein